MRWLWLPMLGVLGIAGLVGAGAFVPELAASQPAAAVTLPATDPVVPAALANDPAPLPEPPAPTILIDSAMSREEALAHPACPADLAEQMELIDVQYHGFEGELRQGQIVVHRNLADEVREIFEEIRESRFPLEKVVPVSAYGWCDDSSMEANNSSGFNYRTIAGSSRMSHHAYGRAIDLNPRLNPYLHPKVRVIGSYDPEQPGTFTRESPVVQAFLKRGWTWGGAWKIKDYHHFEKPAPRRATSRTLNR